MSIQVLVIGIGVEKCAQSLFSNVIKITPTITYNTQTPYTSYKHQ
jgi:hypothetical protein